MPVIETLLPTKKIDIAGWLTGFIDTAVSKSGRGVAQINIKYNRSPPPHDRFFTRFSPKSMLEPLPRNTEHFIYIYTVIN